MENRNKTLNITLAFSLAIFIVALFGVIAKYLSKEYPKEQNINTQIEEIYTPPQEEPPLKLRTKMTEKTKIIISIENIREKEEYIRAFTMEVILDEPLYNLTNQSIQSELAKNGFIFPIKNVEIKENKTIFKLGGVIIGEKLTIGNNQEVILATIDIGKEFEKENIAVSEETKIIDNSGKELNFIVGK